MRVATFNILHGQRVVGAVRDASQGGMLGLPAVDPAHLAEAIEQIDADVLGMQEVDAHQERSGHVDQAAVASAAMARSGAAVEALFVPSVVGTPGGPRSFQPADERVQDAVADGPRPHHGPLYGVALMSRLPVARWQRVTFPAPRVSLPLLVAAVPRPKVVTVPDEPRVAIAAQVSFAGRTLTVATAHLSFVPGVNVRQLKRLVRWLEAMPRPLVLMGDFNLPGALPEWLTGWDRVVAGPTYPSVAPRIRFDHILLDGFSADQVLAARETVQILPLGVSDHCAVVAELPA